ncbi:MAG: protein kinase [Polyangiaceae bacterium]|nr:protein kinase [Polyangiaceae bacterium]
MGGAQARCPACGDVAVAGSTFCTSCGAKFVTATVPGEPPVEALAGAKPEAQKPERVPPGTVIDNKYKVDRVLGEGGMGVVYLAEDVHTGAFIVLKAVRPELAHRRDVRERTLGEGRVLARIDHPNVVHLNAVVEDTTGLWLVMQYIDGESLDKTIKRHADGGERVAFTVALDIFRQVLLGVAAAHREGIIHRDLKPANVLVRRKDGVAKVTDFGIAKPEEQARVGQGKTKGIIGSLWYMSPEQVQGKKDLDKRVDIYSLGILLFELLTGRVPFNADSSYELMRMHVEDPLPKVVSIRSDVPAWIDDLLGRACAKNRDERFGSVEEFLSALDAHMPGQPTHLPTHLPATGLTRIPSMPDATKIGADLQPTAAGTSITGPGSEGGGRGWIYALVGVAALGAGVAGVFFLLNGDNDKPRRRTTNSAPTSTLGTSATDAPPTSKPSASEAPRDPLESLVGTWKSEAGTKFEGVRVGDAIEFRVADAKQLAPSDYRDGEARFILRAETDGTFRVEDKIRPQPPVGKTFDPKSRNTCQEVWTEVDGRPLKATFDGTRLTVAFAKIAPRGGNFTVEDDAIVACSRLKDVSASQGSTVLVRGGS